jgi:hypothetical protein
MPLAPATRPGPTHAPPRPGDVLVARRRRPKPGDLVLALTAAGALLLLPGELVDAAASLAVLGTVHRDR